MKTRDFSGKELRKQMLHSSRLWLTVAILSMLVLSIYNLVISWLLQKIIDVAAGRDNTPLSMVFTVAAVSFAVFVAAYLVYRTARPRFIQKAIEHYKATAFEKILSKPIGSLSGDRTGIFISALTNDVRSVEDKYLDSILTMADIGVSFIGALALMIWYSPALTVISLILSLLPLLVAVKPAKQLAEKERAVSDSNAQFVGRMKDVLSGFSVIKSFQAESEINKRFTDYNHALETKKFTRRFAEENVNLLSTATSVIMRLGVFFAGAWMATKGGRVTPGMVLVFLQLVSFVISPIEQMPTILANRKAAVAIMDKLTDDLREQASCVGIELPQKEIDEIAIQNLSFSYDGHPALRDISYTFEHGKKYAIVGSSGSGKTTLLNLLMQSNSQYSGQILIDHVEQREIDPASYLKTMSLVQQGVFVFNDSIEKNITLYKTFADEEVNRAIIGAGLDDVIKRHGMEYVCGDNGEALSGGERQRISIARAILRQTSVLLMDEATSALDDATAREVMDTIMGMVGVTRIVVTHRIDESIMKQYDEILVLHKGELVEHGAFDSLIEKKGLLYSLLAVSQ